MDTFRRRFHLARCLPTRSTISTCRQTRQVAVVRVAPIVVRSHASFREVYARVAGGPTHVHVSQVVHGVDDLASNGL